MAIHVHNIRTETMPDDPRHVYVGRAMSRRRLKASPLHNPFIVGRDGDRAQVIEQYVALLQYAISGGPSHPRSVTVCSEFDRLLALARTGDLHLYCWCAPEACHADVIKAEIEMRLREPALRA